MRSWKKHDEVLRFIYVRLVRSLTLGELSTVQMPSTNKMLRQQLDFALLVLLRLFVHSHWNIVHPMFVSAAFAVNLPLLFATDRFISVPTATHAIDGAIKTPMAVLVPCHPY